MDPLFDNAAQYPYEPGPGRQYNEKTDRRRAEATHLKQVCRYEPDTEGVEQRPNNGFNNSFHVGFSFPAPTPGA
jgi:hypothetical protein